MQSQAPEEKALALLAAVWLFLAATLATAFALLFPAHALADDVVAHSFDDSGKLTEYTSISAARTAGYAGAVIIMDKDWNISDTFEVADSKTLVINMNGHQIKGNHEEGVIRLCEHAKLTLKSLCETTFQYEYHDSNIYDSYTKLKQASITTGGLVTGGESKPYGGGIRMDAESSLTLDHVAVAGNLGTKSDFTNAAGGIYMSKKCALTMQNKATIEHNRGQAGGVYVGGENVTISLDNSSIKENQSTDSGGGIFSYDRRTTVKLENNSSIDNNVAPKGGGIYFRQTNFSLTSSDKTGSIFSNRAEKDTRIDGDAHKPGGAAVYAESCKWNENEGEIKGIAFTNNCSAFNGGALELAQEWTAIADCVFTGNTAGEYGGAIYVDNDDISLTNCTLTGNACSTNGGNYEGGGVYVRFSDDIKLYGKVIIKGNARGKDSGNADDLFLGGDSLANAYATGGVEKGSKIGIRTELTGACMVGKKINNKTKDCFFADLGGYYISYGSDHGGDMWQRHASKEFLLQVSGQEAGHYAYGTTVMACAASTGVDKVFWHWDTQSAEGLWPIVDYINSENLFSSIFSFVMPQNDVKLKAVYADRIKRACLNIDAPEEGKKLPATAQLQRSDGGMGGNDPVSVPVTWYKVKADGSKIAVSGMAKPGARYLAGVSVPQQPELGLFFGLSLGSQDVTVCTSKDDADEAKATAASVDRITGALNIETAEFKIEGDASSSDEEKSSVTVKLENGGLAFSEEGSENKVVAATGDANAIDTDENDCSLGEHEVFYSDGSEPVVVTAPAREGYNFNHWENVPDGILYDDEAGTVAFGEGQLTEGLVITAIYSPMVTEIDLDMSAPIAGKKLASAVTSLVAKASDGTEADLVEVFGSGKDLSVSWSPDAVKAAGATRYTAVVDLDDAEGYVDLDKVLAQNVVVKVDGKETHATVGFAVQDSRLVFCASFTAAKDVDAIAAKAVKGKTVAVKASKKTGKTAKAKTVAIKAPKSASGTKASFKLVSGSKQLKLNAKAGKVTLKKGAKKGKSYAAKVKVSYGSASKTITVKFKVK